MITSLAVRLRAHLSAVVVFAALVGGAYGTRPCPASADQSVASGQPAADAAALREAVDRAWEALKQGRSFESAMALKKVPADWRPATKPGEPTYFEDLRRAGDLARMRWDLPGAERIYRDALAALEAAGGGKSQEYLLTSLSLAGVYGIWQEPGRADSIVARAGELVEEVFPQPTPAKTQALGTLAHLYAGRQEKTKAAEMFMKGFEVAEQAAAADPMDYARAVFRIGPYFAYFIGSTRAEAVTSKLLDVVKSSVGENSSEYAKALRFAAKALQTVTASPEVRELEKKGKFAEAQKLIANKTGDAERLLVRAVEIHESLGPQRGGEYIEALKDLSLAYSLSVTFSRKVDQAKTKKAKELLDKALQVSKDIWGERDPYILTQVALKAMPLSGGDFRAYVEALTEATDIAKATYGTRNQIYGIIIQQLAGAYEGLYNTEHNEADRQEALKNYGLYVETNRQIYGDRSAAYASILNRLAATYQGIDKKKALELTKRAEEILKTKGSGGLVDLSQRLLTATNYRMAERNYSKAAAIYEEVISKGKEAWGEGGENQYWGSVNNLASLYMEMGEYGKASKLYETMTKSAPGADQRFDWTIELASILTRLGEYDRAEKMLKPMVKDPKDDPMGQSMIQGALGDIYLATGRYKEAVQCYEGPLEALKEQFPGIDVEAMGGFGVDRLFGLAKALQALGERDRARKLYEHVLSKSDSPSFKLGAAEFFHGVGEFERSESLLANALTTLRASVGQAHPDYATGLMQGALLYGAWGKPDKALEDELAGLASLDIFVQRLALWAGENRLQTYLGTVERRYDLFYSLLAGQFTGERPEAWRALDQHLSYKGRLVEAVAARNRLALLSRDPGLGKTIEDLKDVTQQIAHLSLRPPKDMKPAQFKEFMGKLEEKRRGLEESLARGAAGFGRPGAVATVKAEEFAAALPAKATYVDFVEYAGYDYSKQQWTGERRYLAFLVSRDAAGKAVVRIEDLGPAQEINGLVTRVRRRLVEGGQPERGVGGIRPAANDAAAAGKPSEAKGAQEELFAKLFGPFKAYLDGAETLVVAPSGNLNLVPFEVLREAGREGYLCDRVHVVYGLGRDMLAAKSITESIATVSSSQKAAIVAAPDYSGAGGMTGTAVAFNKAKPLSRGTVRDWPVSFDGLPGTAREAETIGRLAKGTDVSILTGDRASEAAVKALSHLSILHFATHGFFLEDVDKSKAENTRGVGGIWTNEPKPLDQAAAQLRNPSLRSGLALAGANRLASNVPISEGEEDGILTAAEVTGMDLQGTDLVVLSACETGLGDVQRGEGVFGLRRAFKIAGAKNIVMSLWSVPDEETVWLMEKFYTAYLAGNKPAMALNKARTAVRKRLIARDGIDNPYYWAAFVVEGTDL